MMQKSKDIQNEKNRKRTEKSVQKNSQWPNAEEFE